MEALRELFLTLGLDADEAKFATATAAVDALEAALGLAAEAAKFLGEQLVEAVVGTAEYAGTVGDAATMTGVGAEQLQELGYAAVQSGSSLEEVVGSLTFLNRNLSAAAHGGAGAAEAFGRLGVRTRDANGAVRDTYGVFLDAADALSKLPPGAERGALAMELFGRSGARLLPLFEDGAEGLRVMAGEARAMGAVMSTEAVASSKRFGDGLAAMRVVLEGVRHELGALLITELEPVLSAIKEWVLANRQLISQKVKAFVDALSASVKLLVALLRTMGKAVEFAIENWKLFAMVIGSVVLAKLILMKGALLDMLVSWTLNTVAAGIYGAQVVRAALASAAAWVSAVAPVILLSAALLLAALAAEDVYTFLQGGDSLIGDLGPKFTQLLDNLSRAKVDDNDLQRFLRWMLAAITDIEGRGIPQVRNALVTMWTVAKQMAREFFNEVRIGIDSLAKSLGFVPGLNGAINVGRLLGGGAAGPEESTRSSTSSTAVSNHGPMTANFVIQQQPGESPMQVAERTRETFSDWWETTVAQVPFALPGSSR